jgi:hypothetical protein
MRQDSLEKQKKNSYTSPVDFAINWTTIQLKITETPFKFNRF